MFNSQSFKTFSKFFILCLLIACLWFFGKGTKSQNTAQFEKQLRVTANQLSRVNGVIPVELKCENAELSAPNALENLPCAIKNNTNNYITAVTVAISLVLDKEGTTSTDSSFLTIETFVHPDFREEHKNNLIPPRGERPIQDLPVSYDNAVIKGVMIQVDYVEFADNTTLGPNHAGSRIITDIRQGAAKYKNWLVQKYKQNGKSIDAIVPLLEPSQPFSEELGISNGDQQEGARIYRNYARRSYEAKGPEALTKHLKQTIP